MISEGQDRVVCGDARRLLVPAGDQGDAAVRSPGLGDGGHDERPAAAVQILVTEHGHRPAGETVHAAGGGRVLPLQLETSPGTERRAGHAARVGGQQRGGRVRLAQLCGLRQQLSDAAGAVAERSARSVNLTQGGTLQSAVDLRFIQGRHRGGDLVSEGAELYFRGN